MSTVAERFQARTLSPAVLRAAVTMTDEALTRRRIGWIWGLLFLNVLPYYTKSPVLHLPTSVGKVITQGALVVAFVLAVSINRRVLMRPNLFLFMMSILCVTSVMMSLHLYFGYGSVLRAGRLVLFVAILWLLTPWWGRQDLLFLRFHRRALYVVLAVVLLGMAVAHHAAFAQAGGGRLGGAIWPIPPTQVAEYAAILAGTTIVLWLTGLVRPRTAAIVAVGGVAIIVLTHTRTALVALLLATLVAGLSLFLSRQRVRKALIITAVVGALVALSFAPFLTSWFTRDQTSHSFLSLSGRSQVWKEVSTEQRSEINTLFGYGMSNDSFNGLSIDSGWYSTYVDQGIVGDAIDGGVLLLLFLLALFSPTGPRRAIALFMVTYCLLASFTETGLGEASPYLLDLAVAMSVVMAPLTSRHEELPEGTPHFS